MDSEQRTQTSTAVPHSDSSSDVARITSVLGGFALILFLLLAGAALLAIEAVSSSRPGYIEVDQTEMAEAQRLVQTRSQLLDELRTESAALDSRIRKVRSGDRLVAPIEPVPIAGEPAKPDTSRRLTSPSKELPKPDEVSRMYVALLAQGARNVQPGQLANLTAQQRKDLSQLMLAGLEADQADPELAARVIEQIGDDAAKATLVRKILSAPMVSLRSSNQANFGLVLVGLCQSLPEPERTERLSQAVMDSVFVDDTLMRELQRLNDDLSDEDRKKLAVWMAHPNEEIRKLAYRIVPEESLWESATAMLAGDSFIRFMYANRWLSEQDVDDRHRRAVLDALRPLLFVRDDDAIPSLNSYCKWADKGEADAIAASLAKPIKNKQIINGLIDTAIRLELPLTAIIDQSSSESGNQWFQRYVEGDRQVSEAFQELLLRDPPLPSLLRWMDQISREGTAEQLDDMRSAVDAIMQSKPDSLLANRAVELLRKMQQRLPD